MSYAFLYAAGPVKAADMLIKLGIFFATLFLLLLIFPPLSSAQMRARVNWSAVSGSMSGVWVAYEEGIFKRNGLEIELLHIPSSSRAIQTMLAGELHFGTGDALNAIQAALQGADIVMISAGVNRFVFSLMARPEIKKVTDLRGKKIGVTRIGSSTHTATLHVMSKAGLNPGDYSILPLIEVPNILTAILAGKIDAGVVSPPTNSRARKEGLSELLNLATEGPEFPSMTLLTTRSYIKASEEVTRRVVRSYAEAVHLFKSNKQVGIKAIQKYARVKEPDIVEDTYVQFREYLESIPYVSYAGLRTILTNLAEKEPRAREAKPEDFMDMRFVAELEKEGLFKRLWGK